MIRLVVAGVALLFASEARAETPTASFPVDLPVDSDEARAPAPNAATAAPPSRPAATANAATATPPSTRPPPMRPSLPPAPEYLNYRLSMALTDVAAVTVLIMGGVADAAPVASVGLGVYALDGPTIHLIHQQGGRAAASLALRVGLPLLLGLGGYALGANSCTPPSSSSSDPYAEEPDDTWGFGCGLAEIALGGFGVASGMLTAMLVDDIALGRVRLRRTTAPSKGASGLPAAANLDAARSYEIGLAPFLAPHGQGGGMMLVGTF